ncbi:MAG: hypothetical protein ACD_75C00309G0009 [uncultured bacterium]|nr:MAG: hypothetical protein ACD_75C00309G0009 [uncultured bacterium]
MIAKPSPHIGTCSWKYDSWRGLIYSDAKEINYLREYSRRFSTVEVDQWFWSLFAGDKAVLPNPIRLHGGDRKEIEDRTGNDWSRIVEPKDHDLQSLAGMIVDLRDRNVETFLYVNNHFEGSAPRTIARIQSLL